MLSAGGLEEAACDREGMGSRAAADHQTLWDPGLDGPHDCPGEGGGPAAARFGGVLCHQEGQLGVWLKVSAC